MIIAVLIGPVVAVQITEYLRRKNDNRNRKVHVFRTLMATRSATLAPQHIEALNLVEIEFFSIRKQDRKVVDAWKLYLAHLNDIHYPKNNWQARRADLLMELLYEMSIALDYGYDKAHIKSGTYYPSGYEDNEVDHLEMRKLLLEVLRGKRGLPVTIQAPNRDYSEANDPDISRDKGTEKLTQSNDNI